MMTAPSLVLAGAGVFIVLLAESCRVPVDDPLTHLELTMIHEVMVLDHGGPALGLALDSKHRWTGLLALLDRGGVIFGSSAGAIIQGSFVVRGRPDKPHNVATARACRSKG